MTLFFDYHLPDELVAQAPAPRRDDARLLVVDRAAGTLDHRHIRDLPAILRPHDLLVLNDTKVLPARLIGSRVATGGRWEALVLAERDGIWECLAQTRGFAKPGERFRTGTGLELELLGRDGERHWLLKPLDEGTLAELLTKHGTMPLPPYIRKGVATAGDIDRYQTVYARNMGSVAAPTAGLHFTPELLQALDAAGIAHARVTLHVGLGTFAPVKVADPLKHSIHAEWCEVNESTVRAVNAAQTTGGRVIAVGTTTVRTLETAANSGTMSEYRGDTSLFIHPPYQFQAVDALLTNFHLPRTTLLLMVQALCGAEMLRHAYETAIREKYRFYSYGDAMLVV